MNPSFAYFPSLKFIFDENRVVREGTRLQLLSTCAPRTA